MYAHFKQEAVPDLLSTLLPAELWDAPKPRKCFWISDEAQEENCWSSKVKTSGILGSDRLRYRYDVALCPDAKIEILRHAGDIRIFSHDYGDYFTRGIFSPGLHVEWEKVAADGIQAVIVSPWHEASAESMGWVWSWGCSSGAVLDPAAIAAISEPVLTGIEWAHHEKS